MTCVSSGGGRLSFRATSNGVPDAIRLGFCFGMNRLGSLDDFLKGGGAGPGRGLGADDSFGPLETNAKAMQNTNVIFVVPRPPFEGEREH